MKPVVRLSTTTALSLLTAILAASPAGSTEPQPLPPAWIEAWNDPPAEDRPMQIVHGLDPRKATREGMQSYRDLGLGGIVANVAFHDYMRSEEHWKTLETGVRSCEELGMVVWLYDEDGYPSGAAGGLVLAENPAFEAAALAYDPTLADPFIVRPSYEHTHASNNYYAARRYVNLLDDRATKTFIEKTHAAYARRLGPHFGHTIQAMFTDEPSLLAVNLGTIPEPARSRVRVADPIDPAVRPLPSVPWCYDLAEQYRTRYGEDLLAVRKSLFTGDEPDARRVRRQFWALVGDLVAERYFAAIQRWCREHGVASSGHNLWEEAVMHHPALYGNGLKALRFMDIPGLDQLNSDPEVVAHGGWMTAALPLSAAVLEGRRRLMTEVSDFSQKQAGSGPADLDAMRATAAWQAAWGVTEFTLYYSPADRPAAEYRAYNDFVGRLNAVLRPARPDPKVLLYYPIYDLWAEYLPVAEPLGLPSQSARARQIVESFNRLGTTLQRSQISFVLIDHESLAQAAVADDGSLAVGEHRFEALIVPQGVELPSEAAKVAEAWRGRGGRILAESSQPGRVVPQTAAGQDTPGSSPQGLIDAIRPAHRLSPPSPRICLGRFLRDGRTVLLVANVGRDPYEGQLSAEPSGPWQMLDPADGAIRPAESTSNGNIRLRVAPRQSLLLVP